MQTEIKDDEEILILASENTEDDEPEEPVDPKERKKLLRKIKKQKKKEKEENKTTLQVVGEYIRIIAGAALIAFLICKFVIINAVVPTLSMSPTIKKNDRIIGLRIPYYFTDPERGDVVIFKTPDPANEGQLYIKRVIGLPGETVVISKDSVKIVDKDGKITELEEDYLTEDQTNVYDAADNTVISVTLGDDEYFMMGDNRKNSSDSRVWGPVKRDAILAKAWLKYYKGFKIF